MQAIGFAAGWITFEFTLYQGAGIPQRSPDCLVSRAKNDTTFEAKCRTKMKGPAVITNHEMTTGQEYGQFL
jgi:hypothetical protein